MKKTVFWFVVSIFLNYTAISQNIDHINGGRFFKRIENNIPMPVITFEGDSIYNVENKSIIERILFGATNSFVEFVTEGSYSSKEFDTLWAFRIVSNAPTDSYRLEAIRVSNVTKEYSHSIRQNLSDKVKEIFIPDTLLQMIPEETQELIKKHNKEAMLYRHDDILFRPYRPAFVECQISKALAEKIHGKMATLIGNFRVAGMPASVVTGGNNVTFRCVVGAEVWSLNIRQPQRRALRLSDISRQLITDVINGGIDESKYIQLLDEI